MKNAVIYARFSSSNQREESIEGQVRECEARAEADGYNIIKIYKDEAVSGTSVEKRSSFLQMIEEAKAGFFQRIYVYKYDRFARNVVDSQTYEEILKRFNVELVSVKEGVPEGASGFLVKGMHELLAQYYSVNLSENVKRGHETNALKCKWNGSRIYGYKRSADGYFEIVEKEAQAVRLMYELYDKGYTMQQIVKELQPFESGNKNGWHVMRVSRFLKSPRYKGTYIYDKHVVEDGIPAIVDKELWERVNDKMNNKSQCAPRRKCKDFPLSAKLFDEYGNAYVGTSGKSHTGKTYYYYKNTATKELIAKDLIDNAVAEALGDVLSRDEAFLDKLADEIMHEQDKELEATSKAVISAMDKIEKLEKKIDNCVDVICESGNISNIVERMEKMKDEKFELEQFVATSKDQYITRDMVVFALSKLKDKIAPQFLADGMVESVIIKADKSLLITLNIKEKTSTSIEPVKVCLSHEWWAGREYIQTTGYHIAFSNTRIILYCGKSIA